jgi:hypothetical protein
MEAAPVTQAAHFVKRWSTSGGSERANYALFLTELCDLLGVPRPEPSLSENARNAYVFDRAVTFTNGDGTTSTTTLGLVLHRLDLAWDHCFGFHQAYLAIVRVVR